MYQRTRLTKEIGEFLDEMIGVDANVWPWMFIGEPVAMNPTLSFAPANEPAIG